MEGINSAPRRGFRRELQERVDEATADLARKNRALGELDDLQLETIAANRGLTTGSAGWRGIWSGGKLAPDRSAPVAGHAAGLGSPRPGRGTLPGDAVINRYRVAGATHHPRSACSFHTRAWRSTMLHLRNAVHAALAAVLLLATGCTGSTDFSITANFVGVNSSAGVRYDRNVPVDLQAQAPDAWKHRSKVKSLDLVGLDGTATRITAPPMSGAGAIWIGPGGALTTADPGVVQVGSWPSETITAAPHAIGVTLSGASLDVIESALKGDGRFVLFLTGTTVDSENFDATAVLHIKLKYKIP